ncbi:MAG: hypothetical protein ACRBDL_00340 [Alphaproteobacteria bacterium]
MEEVTQHDKNTSQGTEDVKEQKKPVPGMLDSLAGESKDFVADLSPYLPQDLIGGALPHIPGAEDEAVWNAASQACGTEKVHYCYTVDDGRVWYLACPSASLASNPDSWCPLAAALPGNSEYWDKETVYLYEQEGLASALRWDPETSRMQVFLGASRTILPRVQSMDANFVTINSGVADIAPWKSRTLRTEKLSRAVVRLLVFSGLLVNLFAVLILVFNLISIGFTRNDLSNVKEQTDKAAVELAENAANVMQSDTIRHMVRIQEILDKLAAVNGYMVVYRVEGDRTEWSAIVPQGLANTVIDDLRISYIDPSGKIRTARPTVSQIEEGDNARINGTK